MMRPLLLLCGLLAAIGCNSPTAKRWAASFPCALQPQDHSGDADVHAQIVAAQDYVNTHYTGSRRSTAAWPRVFYTSCAFGVDGILANGYCNYPDYIVVNNSISPTETLALVQWEARNWWLFAIGLGSLTS